MDLYNLNDPEGRARFVKRVRLIAQNARALADSLDDIATVTVGNDIANILALETVGEIVVGADNWPLVRGDVVLGWTKRNTPDNLRSLVTDLTNDEIDLIIASLQGNPDGMKATLTKLADQKRGK